MIGPAEGSGMPGSLSIFIFWTVVAAFLAGLYGERWRAGRARRKWQSSKKVGDQVLPFRTKADAAITDPSDQLRVVMSAKFEKRRILSKLEARVFYAAERAIKAQELSWRVMAQVSLGEILSSPDARAYSSINSKRVDVLIISSSGDPIAAIEFQGSGHYQGAAPARDAVKKEALRKAGVRYIEVTPEHGAEDLAREISRIASAEMLNGSPQP
jgi:hypothetical protein